MLHPAGRVADGRVELPDLVIALSYELIDSSSTGVTLFRIVQIRRYVEGAVFLQPHLRHHQ
jgi:hypothetical protein